jgi:hypothetical protein
MCYDDRRRLSSGVLQGFILGLLVFNLVYHIEYGRYSHQKKKFF